MSDWYQIRARAEQKSAEILIYSDIGESWDGSTVAAREFVAAVGALDVETITVRINSYGGSVTDGLAIYNALRRHPARVDVQIDGIAASIASLIAMAGDTVTAANNAMLMIHAPWGMAMGNAQQMREMADVLDIYAASMITAYERDGVDMEQIRAWLTDGKDHWLNADDAWSARLIDDISPALAIAASIPERYRIRGTATSTQETAMSVEQTTAAPEQPTVSDTAAIQASAQASVRAAMVERNRNLKSRFDGFALANPGQIDALRSVYDDAVADLDVTAEVFTDRVLAKLAETAKPTAGATSVRVDLVADVRDKFRSGMASVVGHRVGVAADDRGNPYRGSSLSEIAAQCLKQAGIDTRGWTKTEIASRVLAALSTSDFDYLMAHAAQKRLQAAFGNFPSTWRQFCATGSVSDFKTISLVKLGSFNDLDTIPEGGQYTAGTVADAREQLTPSTKGKMIRMTRQMIINDDLSGFARLAGMLGQAAARTINKDVYSAINTNGNLADGTALFATARTNLSSSSDAISVATLGAGRAAMRKYKDLSSRDYLNIMPRTLLVPVAKEDHARVIIESATDTDTAAALKKNPIQSWSPLAVISDPYLDATSTTAWYLIADPMEAPLLEVHFLDGNEAPFIDQTTEFDTDAIAWKVRLDYGVAANEWRGGYKNSGA